MEIEQTLCPPIIYLKNMNEKPLIVKSIFLDVLYLKSSWKKERCHYTSSYIKYICSRFSDTI